MDFAIPWPLAVLGLAVVEGFRFLVDRRRFSGRIARTDADRLWDEQEEYRKMLTADCEKRIDQLTRELEAERLRRSFQVLNLRLSNHQLRNDLVQAQFFSHPDIPGDVKKSVISSNTKHLRELQEEVAEYKRLLEEKGIMP